ncbi:methyl-accepting chemotaxis protein, partial [Paracidovorax sp. MALMAid1276]
AVTQMDQATQQNAALVEEMAAAASALNAQAGELVNAVAVFRLDAAHTTRTAPAAARPASAMAPAPAPAPRVPAPPRTPLGYGATARKPAAKPVASLSPSATPPAAKAAAAPKPAAPGQAEDEWESF